LSGLQPILAIRFFSGWLYFKKIKKLQKVKKCKFLGYC